MELEFGLVTIAIFAVLGSAAFSYLLNRILAHYFKTVGQKGTAGEGMVRWASTSKPTVGGISFYVTFLLASLVYFLGHKKEDAISPDFLALVIVSTLGFVIGLYDDAYHTKPLIKLGGQIACGGTLILFGIGIHLTGIAILDWTLTLFWFVGIMNSVNLLDNMDGVTGTISSTILLTIIAVTSIFPMTADVGAFIFTISAVLGALVGFLILNYKPAKIWMGDTGSQFLGAFLAFLGVKFLWNIQSPNHFEVTGVQLVIPIMTFLVCIMDTSFVTFARIRRGVSPMQGGRDHITHHLTYLQVPEFAVPIVLGLVSLLSGLLAVFTVRYVSSNWGHLYTAIFGGYILLTVAVFFYYYRKAERIAEAKNFYQGRRINLKAIKTPPTQEKEKA